MRDISNYLISNEKKHNKDVKDYLQMTYRLTQDFTSKGWTDVKPEEIGKEVKARQTVQNGVRYQDAIK